MTLQTLLKTKRLHWEVQFAETPEEVWWGYFNGAFGYVDDTHFAVGKNPRSWRAWFTVNGDSRTRDGASFKTKEEGMQWCEERLAKEIMLLIHSTPKVK